MKRMITSLTVATGLAVPAATIAEENSLLIDEVVVTAQKRKQRLADVPISVAVVSGDKIAQNAIGNLDELSASVPNLSIAQSSGTTFIVVRGLGSGDDFGIEQSVGMFIDGVYAGRSRQFRAPLFDINHVEVLKGPQGTLFGKNTIAGAINITSAKPTDTLEASATLNYETEFDQLGAEGIVSGPLTEELSGRLAVKYLDAEGTTYNSLTKKDDIAKDETLIRGSLLWRPNEDLDILTKYETSTFETEGNNIRLVTTPLGAGYAAFYPVFDPNYREDEFRRSAGPNEKGKTDSDNMTVTVNWTVGENVITSVSAYSGFDYDESQDVDFGPLPLLERQIIEDFEQFSQELRITSPIGDRFDYIAGVYFQTSELDNQANLDINLGILPPYAGLPQFRRTTDYKRDTDTIAAFGQASWHFSDRYHLTLGLRYTHEEVDASRKLVINAAGTNTPLNPAILGAITGILNNDFGTFEHDIQDDRSVNNLSPSINFQFDVNDDFMLYTSATKGFKSGGFNAAETTPSLDTFEYDDEEAVSYEIGGKLTALEGQGYLNFSLFYTDFDDLQVSSFIGTRYVTDNAASATSQGVEIDSRWRFTDNLSLTASAAYIDAEYDKYEQGPCVIDSPSPVNCSTPSQDLSGTELSLAPNWTANVALEHQWNISGGLWLKSQLEASYVDSRYLSSDLDKNIEQPDYTLVNGRLGLFSDQGWELSLIGKNLTDKEVAHLGNDASLQNGVYALYLNTPRTLAVQLNMFY